jgi:hypothetical protein
MRSSRTKKSQGTKVDIMKFLLWSMLIAVIWLFYNDDNLAKRIDRLEVESVVQGGQIKLLGQKVK